MDEFIIPASNGGDIFVRESFNQYVGKWEICIDRKGESGGKKQVFCGTCMWKDDVPVFVKKLQEVCE